MNSEYVIFNARRYGRSYEQMSILANTCNQLQKENTQLKTDLQSLQQTLDKRTSYWHKVEMENFAVKREKAEIEEQLTASQQAHQRTIAELQALRELLKEVEFNWDAACNICHETMKHEPGCRMKTELDKLEVK